MLIQYVTEEVHLYALLQARLNRCIELIKVLLLLHRQHDGLKVCANIFADLRRQVNVFHRCVGCVNDILLCLSLAADLGNQHSQLTKDICLENCAS